MTNPHDNENEPICGKYEDFGCRVNAIGVDDLFRRYQQAGFLYPNKMQRLAPYWSQVCENWTRGFRGGELIHYVVSAELPNGAWASITSWRSTTYGWNTQHLVGIGGPAASRAVMLSTQAVRIQDQLDKSHQNWFQRTNRFANKVFGSITSTLGCTAGWVGDYSYYSCPLSLPNIASHRVMVRHGVSEDLGQIRQVAERARSPVFVAAEELDAEDLHLECVDSLYRKVGLRRYRRVLIADLPGLSGPAGIALIYRGPLGFNFSFLENRCDLLLNPALVSQTHEIVIASLLAAAAPHYADFTPGFIPVVIDRSHACHLNMLGGEHVRDYAQSMWLSEGYRAWYRHVESIYDRVARAERRRDKTSADADSSKDSHA